MAQKQQGIQAFLTDGSRLKMREPTHVLCLSWSNIIVVISKRIHIQRIPCFSKAFKLIKFPSISQIPLSNCISNSLHFETTSFGW